MDKRKCEINIRKNIKKNISKGKLKEKSIVLFGCVPDAKIIKNELERNGYVINYIVDNNSSKIGQEWMGCIIETPEQCLQPYDRKKIIIVCSIYWREMVKQLEEYGYNVSDNIMILFAEKQHIYRDSFFEMIKSMHCVIRGKMIYKKYLRMKEGAEKLFICPYPGTGDVYMAGRYFKQYLNKQNIENYVFLVRNKACMKVASLFGIDNIFIISEEEKELLMKAFDFFGYSINIKPLLYWGWRTKKQVIQRFCKDINFNDMFKYDVFNLSIDDKAANPVFDDSSLKGGKYDFIKENKTVILSPYAGSFKSEIPNEFWEILAEKLADDGYLVLTNSSGIKEPVIKGTKAIFFDLREAVPFIEHAGVFVGLRSGLCDVISTSRAKKIVLYENGLNAAQYEFFGLDRMGLCTDSIEYIYMDQDALDFAGKVYSAIVE